MSTLSPAVAAVREGHVVRQRRMTLLAFAGFAVVGLLAAGWGTTVAGRYGIYVATMMLTFITAVAGLNILFGFAGQLSLGHGAFFAIGAYFVGIGLVRTTVTFVPLLLGALVVSVALALLLVLPTLRVAGVFLAMVTLAYAIIVDVALINGGALTGGALGLNIRSPLTSLWVRDAMTTYFVALVVAGAAILVMWLVRESAFGRALHAIKDSDVVASCLGVPVRRFKVLAFTLAAGFATVAGALYGVTVSFLTPIEYDAMLSINMVIAVIVGGSGTILGPILGAAAIVLLPELFRPIGELREILLGVLLVAVLAFGRGGLAALLHGIAIAPARLYLFLRGRLGTAKGGAA